MKKILLNSDLGESFGAYQIGNDEEIIKKLILQMLLAGFMQAMP